MSPFRLCLSKFTKLDLLVSLPKEVCIDFNLSPILFPILSLSLSLSLSLFFLSQSLFSLSLPLLPPYCLSMGISSFFILKTGCYLEAEKFDPKFHVVWFQNQLQCLVHHYRLKKHRPSIIISSNIYIYSLSVINIKLAGQFVLANHCNQYLYIDQN